MDKITKLHRNRDDHANVMLRNLKEQSLGDLAAYHASQGWAVFPCNANKSPCTPNGFYNAVTDPDQAKALFTNYPNAALIGGATGIPSGGRVVIDLDLYKGPHVAEWAQETGLNKYKTQTVATQSGGLHKHFLHDQEYTSRNPIEGVEVKADGGYVILADGEKYTLDNADAPLSLPKTIADHLIREPKAFSDDATIPDWFEALNAADKYDCVKTAFQAFPDGWESELGRYEGWIALGFATYRALGPDGFGIWYEHSMRFGGFNPDTDSVPALQKKYNSFRKDAQDRPIGPSTLFYHARGYGWADARWIKIGEEAVQKEYAELLKKLEARGGDDDEPDPETDNLYELLSQPPAPYDWVTEDLAEAGELVGILGQPKVGKGRIGLAWFDALINGKTFYGRQCIKTPCVYFASEDKKKTVQRRMHQMKLTTDCRVSLVKDTKFRSQQAAMQFLAQFLVDNPKIKVIFIDTLRYFFGTREVSQKNAQDQDFEMLEPLRELAKSANVTIIAMLHEKKPQMNQGPERMTINEAVGGSALIAGTFYSIIRIVKPKKQLRKGITTGYIELQGRETANDESIQVKSDKQAGRWIELDDLEQAAVTALAELRSGTIAASIISELQAAGGELTRFELREKLKFQGHGVDAIKKALQRAAGTGKVHLIGETDLSPVRLVVQ